MNKLRRQLISLAAIGVSLIVLPKAQAAVASENNSAAPEEWRLTIKRWLKVLMPLDNNGRGGDSKEVWQALEQLMQNPDFKEGFLAGVQAIDSLPLPSSSAELSNLLRSKDPRAQFLNAFFEIVIEGFYGSAAGWSDFALKEPPQPHGYLI